MNPQVPEAGGGVGTSFKGTAKYLLHDIGAATQERVGWSKTFNLMSDDPEIAWRIMAATAIDSDRLKREHHERQQKSLPEHQREPYRASKKSFNHVFHYALTWHPEEAAELNRDIMMREAKNTLRILGADDLQSLIICHLDTDHPHIHVMVNRIHPETGKVVPVESNTKNKLRDYALQLDRERGYSYAPQREINALKREAGISYQSEKRVSRHIYEQQVVSREVMKLSPDKADKLRRQQAGFDLELANQERAMFAKHRKMANNLSDDHRHRKAMINRNADDAKREAKKILSKHYGEKLKDLADRHKLEQDSLKRAEESDLGKLLEHLKAVGRSWNVSDESKLSTRISETFKGFGNRGYALRVLKREQERQRNLVTVSFKRELQSEIRNISVERRKAISDNYERFEDDYKYFNSTRISDKNAMSRLWQRRDEDRATVWRDFEKSVEFERDFKDAASRQQSREKEETEKTLPKRERRPRSKDENVRQKAERIKRKFRDRNGKNRGR